MLFVAAVFLTGVAQACSGFDHVHLWVVLAALVLFFAVFNYLEARLPALLTQAAPAADRGAALGVFATSQFLGAFFGGVVGRRAARPVRHLRASSGARPSWRSAGPCWPIRPALAAPAAVSG